MSLTDENQGILREIEDCLSAPVHVPPEVVTAAYDLGYRLACAKACGCMEDNQSPEGRDEALLELLEATRIAHVADAEYRRAWPEEIDVVEKVARAVLWRRANLGNVMKPGTAHTAVHWNPAVLAEAMEDARAAIAAMSAHVAGG